MAAAMVDTGDLREGLAAKQSEAASLKAEVQRFRLEAQQLRLRLQAAGAESSLVPGQVQAGSGNAESQQHELRSLFQWLVESVDLSHQVVFECGSGEGEVQVGGRRVLLQRMATWQLSSHAGLKLSVPLELQAELAGLLHDARKRGRLAEAQVQTLANSWELVGAEVVAASMGAPEPAIFLVHRQTAQAVVVAQWPSVEFVKRTATPIFDPDSHFSRLTAQKNAGGLTFAAPLMPKDTQRTPKEQAQWAAPAVTLSKGDLVEVEYEGTWFTGVLEGVEGDMANVKCDVDGPGVITVAPLKNVRPARTAARSRANTALTPDKKPSRHVRARSVG
eukprot:TRINITY_DN31771_c0_g1_i1.p1 TRINITY_DN31771_c0_g1~~TRINITY_DN31771_c0_g1_i1.p1  ORF type:complete len:333 (-),score=75.47 TRINITY_DN31771_c0_g1_i1:167-1165(-)